MSTAGTIPAGSRGAAGERRRRRPPAPRARVRWDRVSRGAMLLVLLGLLYLYISPVSSLIGAIRESGRRNAEVARLQRANASLKAQRDALGRASTLERNARNLGLVRAGERAYVVSGLPAN